MLEPGAVGWHHALETDCVGACVGSPSIVCLDHSLFIYPVGEPRIVSRLGQLWLTFP